NEYYEVRLNPGKGYGCFALKPIQRGTRILADSPLLIVREPEYLYDDIKATYDKLSPTDQALYMSLHSAHNQDPANWPKAIHPSVKGRERKRIEEQASARFAKEPSLISIFQTNCIEHESGAAIFPYAARFNHSCSPNACFTWNSAIGKETIHATRNINCGEEITVAYCDTTHSKSLRRYELKHYGFLCDCRACNDESDPEYASKSAERRYRLQELEDLLASMRESGKHWGMGPESIPQLLEMVNLLLEEGDYTNRLAATYMDIALVCEAQGDLKFAKKAAEKALQVSVDCYGLDHPTMMDHFILYERLKDKMEGGKAKSEDAVENEVDS
ncbi:SET domain-containing protein, partial [Delitschia confertaspora ATCC 74209]